MDNQPNNTPNPGGETLNDRLRRAAAMRAQRASMAPTTPPPATQSRPQPQPETEPEQLQVPPSTPHAAAPAQPQRQSPPPAPPVTAPTRSFPEDDDEEYVAAPPVPPRRKGPVVLIIGLVVALAIAIAVVVFMQVQSSQQAAEQQDQIEQLQLQNQQMQLANEYDALNNEFAQYENQTSLLANDSIVQKYSAARAQVEKLLQELQNEKNKSAAQIQKLKDEITTLKAILRNYVEQINALSHENQELRSENQEVKAQNQQLTSAVQSAKADNKVLNERMTLAEKLNVTGVNLVALNKKGKTEKNVTKARQLMVTFTIPQNNSTPVGEKTIYLRIVSPEGSLLGNGGSFPFEGSSVACTASKRVEYAGEEIGGIKIYWDVNTTLTPGDYTVELFADNYRLASRHFTLRK